MPLAAFISEARAPAVALALTVMFACLAACTEEAPPVPDLSGIWARNSMEFEEPASGPGPVMNRVRGGRALAYERAGDYTNPTLNPAAAERVKQLGEISLAGVAFPEPDNQCAPWPVPYILRQLKIGILQQPHQVAITYRHDQQVRRIRMNESHPANVTPSVYGDSVGRYEGETLVIDTVGVKVGPLAMVDWYGTPYSEALHVVERYRLIDYEAGKEAAERHELKNGAIPDTGVVIDPEYRGKALQIELTVEDPGVFTTPWKALVTYRRAASEWPEYICAENLLEPDGVPRKVPTAEVPDF
jgi:hypothetical protein